MKAKLQKYIKPWSGYDNVEWLEDLIWCPSQNSLRFTYRGQRFEIYLRWRWNDPWTATLISYPPNSEDDIWTDINEFPFFKDLEYPQAEAWCEEWLLKQLENNKLNKYLIEDGEIF